MITINKNDRINFFKTNYSSIISQEFMEWLIDSGYFIAPASTKYHNAYPGGLFDHSINVTNTLIEYTWKLELSWKREISPLLVGMFHDICKFDEYVLNEHDNEYIARRKNEDLDLLGHGDKSIMLLSQHILLTEEEMFCIRYHMGAYNTNEWSQFDKAIKKYPNVLYTHTADMYASKVLDK